jgi:hypothetical protein
LAGDGVPSVSFMAMAMIKNVLRNIDSVTVHSDMWQNIKMAMKENYFM